MTVDYKDTIFLPKTDFPMRAGLPKKEPEIIARWEKQGLWDQIRKNSEGRDLFVLHDGPPYANGHLHLGHALNKILKDIISRSQQMMGKSSLYVPGWDCHGLPIEWKIEEQYRAKGLDKDEVPINEFRKECRNFAAKWIDVQREEFKRLGVMGDWDNPYITMDFKAEAQIAREIGKFLMNGGLYKGSKPVMWSVVEKTALAEAEVEYKEHKSTTLFVRFPVTKAGDALLENAGVVIWTTTPWTIPANRAIAFGADISYAVYEVAEVEEGSAVAAGEKLVIADDLAEDLRQRFKVASWTRLGQAKGLDQTVCTHPLHKADDGYTFDVPMLEGDFVTTEQGSGFVHIAPGHGMDDYLLGLKHGIEAQQTVAEDGSFYDHVPLFAGKVIYTPEGKVGDANGSVIKALAEASNMLAKENIRHSYPHSWRSKAPLIFRNTAQWFISMSHNDLRETALREIDKTAFYPERGRKRLRSMIEGRPDWCVSRQRAWGVPIPVFVNKETGEPLRDQSVIDRVAAAFEEEGGDAWFSRDISDFLGPDYDANDYEQVKDVVDVWFDSGSTHTFVLEGRDDLKWPADLYLEGSDQHRGWFHSSLLEACGTRGKAPYEAVLTHGFILDEKGRKMSKSLGNGIEPEDVNNQYGADILRLWVVSEDYTQDLSIGPNTLKQLGDYYRRFRNTFRWLLGTLTAFDPAKRVTDVATMPELEQWLLHRLQDMDAIVRKAATEYDFHRLYREVHDFCNLDLSAFYFDIRKDAVYCDAPNDPKRLACLSVLDEVFSRLTTWLAPILCFTAEEAWLTYTGDAEGNSVHLRDFPETPASWRNEALAEKMEKVKAVRRVVLGALEIERAEKRIGASLQAAPTIYVSADYEAALEGVDLAEVAITSGAELVVGAAPEGAFTVADVADVSVVPALADGEKCERCWKVLPEVGSNAAHKDVCGRCADAVDAVAAAAE
ncbi:isoleucine--tRNA ligase [Aestuariispira ectoiniformans]|uniref:isoleucine--tRNA ligase n=1 Tax=Aestuariispira ectoiniformans TaxID=2775080 RepID=UPI00223AA339|nr:isoleucine--tRNA ligase [Aestuariispira ectoiniformans]